MTQHDDVIIPCLYNSFSFTPENNAIVYYDMNTRPVTMSSLYDRVTETEPVAVAVAVSSCVVPAEASESSDASDTSDTSDASDASDAKEVVDTTFHPDVMARYSYTVRSDATDSLLWLTYVMLYGTEKYETIENLYTESNRFKFELIETLRTCKPVLKANKIRISEIEETLVHKPFIHLETLRAIAVCKGVSVCIVQDRKYFHCDNGNSGAFILEKIKGKYVLYLAPMELLEKYLNFIRQNYWLMESISAPIRPISAYKLNDLVDISTRLGLPIVNIIPGKFGSMGTEKRKTKSELYEAIKLKVYL